MFIINFFLEYVLFFILLVVLTIALLSEYGKITIHRSLYLPTILLGLGLNFLFFDIIIDPILGIRSSLLALCAGHSCRNDFYFYFISLQKKIFVYF